MPRYILPSFPDWTQLSAQEIQDERDAAVNTVERLAGLHLVRFPHICSRSEALLRALTLSPDRNLVAAIAERDLDRYHLLLASALASLQFTEAEALLLIDACRGWPVGDAESAVGLWSEVEDSLADDLAVEEGPNGHDFADLVAKLKALSALEAMAVVDAVERVAAQPHADIRDRLIAVGLLRTERGSRLACANLAAQM